MGREKYALVLHKAEWDRLQKSAGTLEEPAPEGVSREYVQGLIDQSQKWVKNWPDTVQGHVLLVSKLKERKHEKEVAMVKAVKDSEKRRKQDNIESIRKAKQMIFDTSCYGKQLLSALLESKIIEERDVQIEFQKKLKKEALALAKEQELNNTLVFNDVDKEAIRKKNKEFAEINKLMHRDITEKIAKEREDVKEEELHNAALNAELLRLEAEAEKRNPCRDTQGMEWYAAENQKIVERKAKQEAKDDAVAKAWRKYYDRVRCKEKQVMKELHRPKNDTPMFQSVYKLTEELLDKEQKKYDDFIEKGVNRFESRNSKQGQKDDEKQKQNRENLMEQVKHNQTLAACQKLLQPNRKHSSEKQTLPICSRRNTRENMKNTVDYEEASPEKPGSFLVPSNKLQQDLERRKKETTPWTGLKGVHEQFAQQAGGILAECRVKKMAQKVVDEHRKVNCLDASSLPVANY